MNGNNRYAELVAHAETTALHVDLHTGSAGKYMSKF